MTALYLYDDARARSFEPFASTRPISELRAGTALIRERWTSLLQPTNGVYFISGDRHTDFDDSPPGTAAAGIIPAGSVIANARCVPALAPDLSKAARRAATCTMWRSGERLAAVRVREPLHVGAFVGATLALDDLYVGTGAIGDVKGRWMDEVWDFIRTLQEQLTEDITCMVGRDEVRTEMAATSLPSHVTVLGAQPVVVLGGERTVIEPYVVLDASAGPIMIDAGSHIRAFTRITGPCYIGRDVTIMGGDVSGCSIGDVSKIRGEISSTIVLGRSNKGHDGFVGHSYLGQWVNLGAGTTTSNLKNTYGTVALWTPHGIRDTGMQFLGTMFGDHVKTGIGLRLTTGTVLGAGANVYGNMPPKVVAPFSWGDSAPYSVYRVDKFSETAARAMSRRHVDLSDRGRRHLASVHAERWTVETEKS